MKKVVRPPFIALVIAISVLPTCAGDNQLLQARVTYWQIALSQGIPAGTSKEKAIEWGTAHNVQFDYLEKQHWLYTNVEQVKEAGFPFPCSEWNIILKVTIDAAGLSSNKEVSTVGSSL